MDFFSAQDNARRNSKLLILWFVLAVVGIILSVYFVLVFAMGAGSEFQGTQQASARSSWWDAELFLYTAVGIGGLILAGSAYKVAALSRHGGAAIAEELGGRLVSRSTSDPLEQRLINVVEEMAIASGIPVPPVYILDAEQGINAFAAGSDINEGVVAVTRGTLEQLSRDELQGVVAHEFSHILNGDMRLNLKLIGVLHGIVLLTLAGRVLMRSARGNSRNAAPIVFGGLALVIVGYIGVLFGKLIKAGVSRQREYLADAAAVQFTRNPSGIAGALRRIASASSTIEHPRAEEASHMFFGSSASLSQLMATHPPIDDRIARIEGGKFKFDGPAPLARSGQTTTATAGTSMPGVSAFGGAESSPPAGSGSTATASASSTETIRGMTPAAFVGSVGTVQPAHVDYTHALLESFPAAVRLAAHQPAGARALVFALLLADPEQIRAEQLELVAAKFGTGARDEILRHDEWLLTADPRVRLPLLDLCLPTLAELSDEAKRQILDLAEALIKADGRTSLFEYVVRRLLRGALDPGERARGSISLKTLKSDTEILLSLLARASGNDEAANRRAFEAATAVAPLDGPWEMMAADKRFSVRELDRILDHLANARPAFRRKLVEAAATTVMHDGEITASEAELLRAVCQALDCPTPPLLIANDS